MLHWLWYEVASGPHLNQARHPAADNEGPKILNLFYLFIYFIFDLVWDC